MIGSLTGRVAGTSSAAVIVEVGGVGYLVHVTEPALSKMAPGSTVHLWTHLAVKDDALTLFGFPSEPELRMFESLLGVSGVGPKAALGMCGALSPESFRRALVTEDLAALTSCPGIGRKTAARIVVDLKEKMALPDLALLSNGADPLSRARSALQNLGYSPTEVRAALSAVDAGDLPVEDVVRSALRVLAG